MAVASRGWGVEAVVSDYDEERFARSAGRPAAGRAEVSALTLEEIFVALVGDRGDRRGAKA